MRRSSWLLLFPALALSAACSNVAASPTGPSALNPVNSAAPPLGLAQQAPVLTGRWQATGTTTFRNLETANHLNWGGCLGSLTIETQQDTQFGGSLTTQGNGYNSDRFCTATTRLAGELVAADGSAARAWIDGASRNWPRPAVTPSCEFISAGDGIWTGSATDEAIRLQVTDTLRCAVNVDGGLFGIPMANFERTVSFLFERL